MLWLFIASDVIYFPRDFGHILKFACKVRLIEWVTIIGRFIILNLSLCSNTLILHFAHGKSIYKSFIRPAFFNRQHNQSQSQIVINCH